MQQLGKGVDGNKVPMPDPQICNLHLAVARVFSGSGFAEVIEIFFKENGDSGNATPSFGDELARRLTPLLFEQISC